MMEWNHNGRLLTKVEWFSRLIAGMKIVDHEPGFEKYDGLSITVLLRLYMKSEYLCHSLRGELT